MTSASTEERGERGRALFTELVLTLLLHQMFIMPAYISWRSTVTHAMAALVLEAKALLRFLSMIRPRSTRPWTLMKPLQPARLGQVKGALSGSRRTRRQ